MPRHFLYLTVLAALAAPLAVATGGAHAESVDLAQATCADFAGMNGNDQAQLSLWLAGYFAGAAQKPLLDLDKINAAPGALQALCAKSPQLSLVSAETRAVFAPVP